MRRAATPGPVTSAAASATKPSPPNHCIQARAKWKPGESSATEGNSVSPAVVSATIASKSAAPGACPATAKTGAHHGGTVTNARAVTAIASFAWMSSGLRSRARRPPATAIDAATRPRRGRGGSRRTLPRRPPGQRAAPRPPSRSGRDVRPPHPDAPRARGCGFRRSHPPGARSPPAFPASSHLGSASLPSSNNRSLAVMRVSFQ